MRHPPLPAPLLWHVYLVYWILGLLAAAWPLQAGLCALLPPCVDTRLRRICRLTLAALVFATAVLVARWQLEAANLPPDIPKTFEQSANPRLCGVVSDVQGLPDNRLRIFLEKTTLSASGESGETAASTAIPGLVAWTWENPLFSPLAGQNACLERRPRPVHSLVNRGLEDFGIWWRGHGVSARLWSRGAQGEPKFFGPGSPSARLRERLREDFASALMPEGTALTHEMPQGKAMLLALLFGDRRFLSQRTMDNFAATALAHSLALSGQHLAVAGLIGLLCVSVAARAWAPLYLRWPRLVWATLAACPPAMLYLWLGNAPPSLVRAGCMLIVLALWLMRRKTATTLDVLCAAVLCISLVNPLCVLDTGMQLSVLCLGVIALSLPLLRVLPQRNDETDGISRPAPLRRAFVRAGQILLLSFILQAALLPLNLLLFGNAGFWFPLNVLWLPLLDVFVLPLAILALAAQAFGLSQSAGIILDLAVLPAQWLADALVWLDGHGLLDIPAFLRPHWTALPAFAALAGAVALLPGRTRYTQPPRAVGRLLIIGCVLLCVGPCLRLTEHATEAVVLSVLDVGQGQAVLLDLPGDARLLVDGGGSHSQRFDVGRSIVVPAVSYNAPPRLTAALNTHPDTDHLAGIVSVLDKFTVGEIFDNGRPAVGGLAQPWESLIGRRRALEDGDSLILGDAERGLRLEVLWPPSRSGLKAERGGRDKDAVDGRDSSDRRGKGRGVGGNDDSLVLRLTRFGEGLVLIPGDCGPSALRRILTRHRDVSAKVLIAPHHGSDKSFFPDFYRAVAPELVLASCGFQNSYGHPGPNLRAWLKQQGIPLLTTSEHGQIRIELPPHNPLRLRQNNFELN
ncbi:MAG: ComEC/Rec2 family competence protein [Desulfovibrio sp.]|jgi:competence protein ComEC|nr:ComEC/Rec2 family competence protein [Desulfovibrio sp.]